MRKEEKTEDYNELPLIACCSDPVLSGIELNAKRNDLGCRVTPIERMYYDTLLVKIKNKNTK